MKININININLNTKDLKCLEIQTLFNRIRTKSNFHLRTHLLEWAIGDFKVLINRLLMEEDKFIIKSTLRYKTTLKINISNRKNIKPLKIFCEFNL